MRIEDFEKEKSQIIGSDPEIQTAWLGYLSSFPHVSEFFRSSSQYTNQIGTVNGRKVGSDINLFKLFTEQCTHLLAKGARCGIVIPSGIYTDLGAVQLRKMLFQTCRITGLFGFENRKVIFEGVHRSFKFVVLTFETGSSTRDFPVAFMRRDVRDLAEFPSLASLRISPSLVARLSPGSLSIMEFETASDIAVAEKLLLHPLAGSENEDTWNMSFGAELHMTNDSKVFEKTPGPGLIPLFEGKMVHQFAHTHASPRYWIEEAAGRAAILGRTEDNDQPLGYQRHRLGFRDIARNTDTRTLIAGFVPKSFCGNTLPLVTSPTDYPTQLFISCCLNSFALDWLIRQKVTTHCSFFYVYQLPIPRLTAAHPDFLPLAERAARLVGTAPEFDDLLKEVFGKTATHQTHGVTAPQDRLTLRAEIDALVARLYDLTTEEFQHILTTFPLVDESVKSQTLNTYRELVKLGKFASNSAQHNRP